MAKGSLQKYLLKQLKEVDCLAWSNNATGIGMRGIPDVTVITYNMVLYIEVKDATTKDKLTKLQEYRINQIENYGHQVYVCRTYDDARFITAVVKQESGMIK